MESPIQTLSTTTGTLSHAEQNFERKKYNEGTHVVRKVYHPGHMAQLQICNCIDTKEKQSWMFAHTIAFYSQVSKCCSDQHGWASSSLLVTEFIHMLVEVHL